MSKLLNDPAVTGALSYMLVVAMTLLAAWLRAKFPTQARRVEDNWTYLKPAVDQAMDAAAKSGSAPGGIRSSMLAIVSAGVTSFADEYRRFEGREASPADVGAARKEIEAAVERAVEGGA